MVYREIVHDLGGDSSRVRGTPEYLEPKPCEEAGSDADEGHGANTGRMAVELSLDADGDRQDRGDEEAKREVGVAGEWQSASAPSATAAGLVLGPGLVGKLG